MIGLPIEWVWAGLGTLAGFGFIEATRILFGRLDDLKFWFTIGLKSPASRWWKFKYIVNVVIDLIIVGLTYIGIFWIFENLWTVMWG